MEKEKRQGFRPFPAYKNGRRPRTVAIDKSSPRELRVGARPARKNKEESRSCHNLRIPIGKSRWLCPPLRRARRAPGEQRDSDTLPDGRRTNLPPCFLLVGADGIKCHAIDVDLVRFYEVVPKPAVRDLDLTVLIRDDRGGMWREIT